MNGMAVERRCCPFGGTFFVFCDYMRRAVRLAALVRAQGRVRLDARLGRRRRGRPDPPAGRAARRAARDARAAGDPPGRRQRGRGRRGASTSTATARPRSSSPARSVPGARGHRRARARAASPRGAYVLVDEERRRLDLVLIGTGSEVSLCVGAAEQLAGRRRRRSRVVSMPSWELFEAQADDVPRRRCCRRRADARGRGRRRRFGWERYADDVVGIDRFGASAPGDVVMREVRLHRRARRRARAALLGSRPRGGLTDDQSRSPDSTTSARAPGTTTSPARCCASGGLRELVDERRHPRRHVEPDDLREGDRRPARATTTQLARRCASRAVDVEDTYWALVIDDIGARRRPAAPGLRRARTAATASCRSRSSPELAHDTDGTIAQAARAARRGSTGPT